MISANWLILILCIVEFIIVFVYIAIKSAHIQKARKKYAELDKNASIVDILAQFDCLNLTDKVQEYLNAQKELELSKNIMDKIIEVTSEEGLVAILDNLRESKASIPQLYSLSKVASEAESKHEDSIEGIDYILKKIDQQSGSKYSVVYEECISKNRDYDLILPQYQNIKSIIQEFKTSINGLLNKDEMDFWDRLVLIICSLDKCSLPLLELEEKDFNGISKRPDLLDRIRKDMLSSYVMQFVKRVLDDNHADSNSFATDVSKGIEDVVARLKTQQEGNDSTLAIQIDESDIQNELDICKTAIDKVRFGEKVKPFIDKMWDYFAKDFCAKTKGSLDDKKWLMENCLNITFHTVDFLEHINKNKDPQYCYNYNFLIHDFDPKQSQAMQYVFQDYSKSTDNSNFIYTVSEEAGVEHLKILVDNYYIKP